MVNSLYVRYNWSLKKLTIQALATMLLLVFGCKPKDSDSQSEGTQKMAKRLEFVTARANPDINFLISDKRIARKKIRFETAPDNEFVFFDYVQELLNAGQNAKALHLVNQRLYEKIGDSLAFSPKTIYYHKLQVNAHIQLGEDLNCVNHHVGASCTIPIQPEAVHGNVIHALKAVEILTQMVKAFPKDYESRWLLNLAYMTMGSYPESVPKAYLVPLENPLIKTEDSLVNIFKNIAMKAGVAVNDIAGGVSLEDFNNDGFLDVMVSAYGLKGQLRYFENNQDGTFTEKTEEAGLTGLFGGLNLVHADYNNDGFVDVFVLRGAWFGAEGRYPNSLLMNKNGHFEDVTEQAGVLSQMPTQTAAWADFNLDGYLDLYVGNETINIGFAQSEFYMNNGDGTFTNVVDKLKLGVTGYIKGVTWGDIDNDMLPDLYVSNLTRKNKLFHNLGGTSLEDWKFEEISTAANVEDPVGSFPTWFWDYNNDGHDDLFVAGYDLNRIKQVSFDEVSALLGENPKYSLPKLYKNNGNNTFTDVTESMGLARPFYVMGCNFGDIDNDGYLDFYLGTGAPNLGSIVPNRMFKNDKGNYFNDVTYQGGFGHIQKGHAIAFGDIDNDGDQDIYAVMGGSVVGDNFPNVLYQNGGNTNAWLVAKLIGTTANRSAIGAKVELTYIDATGQTHKLFRTVTTGGTFGASSLQLEIGLAKAVKVKELKVRWPNKNRTVAIYKDIDINQRIEIKEGESTVKTMLKPNSKSVN
ncbi:CRTAC1 family protein [Aestuariibaculum sediminum]|uniref:CRTAC1 family protein n=1 Tax=Aestuariibaculum sediminum TaxID=2770637 RepID=A0A8J6Q3C7_9FLAO|nr:CRTAC1 family protein [Aestuariibaculum sediminum]MBD0833411.1 CRTAC1 family protein [Aestuariibaculum sediminum]